MLEAGVNTRVIQRLAGWTTMRMLERYGHARDAEMQRAVSVMRDVIVRAQKRSPQENPKTQNPQKLLKMNGVPERAKLEPAP